MDRQTRMKYFAKNISDIRKDTNLTCEQMSELMFTQICMSSLSDENLEKAISARNEAIIADVLEASSTTRAAASKKYLDLMFNFLINEEFGSVK